MNLTMTVKMTRMLFLLCSGFSQFTFASNRLRVFSPPSPLDKKWEVSLRDCNDKNESFVTLYDEEDADFIVKILQNKREKKFWLGLHKNRSITWSDGAPVIFNKSSVILANGAQICEALDNGTWTGFNCTEEKYFMCDNGINYSLIEIRKNWCQALQYCRKQNAKLVSISNETQNDDVIEKGNNKSFWIGLMHDEWEWVDNSCSSFRRWANDVSRHLKIECSQVTSHDGIQLLFGKGCDQMGHSFCSKGATRIKVINQNLTWEEAFNYCKANHTGLLWIEDKVDQFAVEQWLNHTEVPGPFWIGLRQSRVFGFWIWSDRTVAYSNWRNGTQPELAMYNQCGAISGIDYKWSDEDCLVPRPFLCEEEIVFMNPKNSPSLL